MCPVLSHYTSQVEQMQQMNRDDNGEGTRSATALLLIAHGSRRPEANADLHHVAEAMRRGGEHQAVEAAFLELAEPGIDEAAARCAGASSRVVLLPYFLSAGVHVRCDLTDARDRLAQRFPRCVSRWPSPWGVIPCSSKSWRTVPASAGLTQGLSAEKLARRAAWAARPHPE
jgi:cobalamin biosynthesis Co2+ chelatase CbiK